MKLEFPDYEERKIAPLTLDPQGSVSLTVFDHLHAQGIPVTSVVTGSGGIAYTTSGGTWKAHIVRGEDA